VERTVAGTGEVRELSGEGGSVEDVSPDGRHALVMHPGADVYIVPLQGSVQDRAPKPLAEGERSRLATFSPDGRWIVYEVEVNPGAYVQPFPGPGLRTQITTTCCGVPAWRKDGKEIVIADEHGVWSIPVDGEGGSLHFGSPELLFSGIRFPSGSNASSRPLAVSRDGSRIFWVQGIEQPATDVIHILTGW
jgi:hypothetical protein